jgi:uncharacterized protein YigA (DUF484 family)
MITAEDVLHYLRQNPAFFDDNEDILGDLNLAGPENLGPFVEKQIEVLKNRENKQKAKFELVVDSARSNLKLEDDFLEIAMRLLSEGQVRGDPQHIAGALLIRQFNVKEVVFMMVADSAGSRHAVYEEVKQRIAHKSSICDDRVSSSLLESIFDRDAQGIGSCAFIPLVFGDSITGVMVFGSVSQERFSPGMGVNFLDKLGMLVGSYLEGRKPKSSELGSSGSV